MEQKPHPGWGGGKEDGQEGSDGGGGGGEPRGDPLAFGGHVCRCAVRGGLGCHGQMS